MSELVFLPDPSEPPEWETVRRMWAEGCRMADIAAAIGKTSRHIDHLRDSGRLYLPKRPIGSGLKQTPRDPAPAEIRQRCLEIQKAWTPAEEADRRAGSGRCLSDTALRIKAAPVGKTGTARGVAFLPQ